MREMEGGAKGEMEGGEREEEAERGEKSVFVCDRDRQIDRKTEREREGGGGGG